MKALCAAVLGLIVAAALLEGLSRLHYSLLHDASYDASRILGALGASEKLSETASQLPKLYADQREVIHPYTGYIRDYNTAFRRNYGYDTEYAPLQHRSPDKVIIGFFGGSVAMHLHHALERAMAKALADAGDNRRVVLVNFALGGYKQPQQLNTLTYFLAMGAEFDLVINLDGFNELALPVADNLPQGVSPFYPRLWNLRVSDTMDAERLRNFAAVAALQDRLDGIVTGLRLPVLSQSAAWGLVSIWRAQRTQTEMRARMAAMAAAPNAPFVQSGPPLAAQDADAVLAALAGFWARCSRLMQAACQASGCAYLHVLQPNQYVTDSKILSREELATAYAPEAPYSAAALQGYPALIGEGRKLAAEGVPFVDATPLFRDQAGTVYADACCHFNNDGNAMLAAFVAQKALAVLRVAKAP
jgi:hypothetical protein